LSPVRLYWHFVTDDSPVVDFLYEVGQLKRTPRSGWLLARMANQESVADHSFRTAVIAMALAALAGADPDRAATIALLHDLAETRLGDFNHLTRRYVDEREPSGRIVDDQTASLPAEVGAVLRDRAAQWQAQATPEALLAQDADILESILHVRESVSDRPELEHSWVDYLGERLVTDAGRRLLGQIAETGPDEWWRRAVSGPPGETS
jgi:putative hydrolase of HD superfamily